MTVTLRPPTPSSYRVTWSGEGDEFVATCLELPSLPWLAASPEEALHGLLALVAEVADDVVTAGEAEALAPRPHVVTKPSTAP